VTWTVSPYASEDLPKIERFFRRVYAGYGTHGSSAYFRWKIANNPQQPGLINLVRTPEGIGSVAQDAFRQGRKGLRGRDRRHLHRSSISAQRDVLAAGQPDT
jgi:hypothetical protein